MTYEAESATGNETCTNQSPVAGANGHANESASVQQEAVASPDQATNASGKEFERLNQELAEMKDRYLRNVAEMDNMRKRLEREKADFIKFSMESVLKDMIPVLDSFDKALSASSSHSDSGDVASFNDGMSMVQKQFLGALAKHGLEPVEAVGKPFDPNFHQAIQRIESSDVTEEIVATEFMKGYALHGRLIRPAMVSVKVPGGKE